MRELDWSERVERGGNDWGKRVGLEIGRESGMRMAWVGVREWSVMGE